MTDIVLVGGGHAHVYVLKAFARQPEPGVRITLVTRDLETPYSAMLPGVVAGLYHVKQAHIALVRLAAATGTRLIHAEAIGLDRIQKRIILRGHSPLPYDIASLDIGISPSLDSIPGASQHALPVKPIGQFLSVFERMAAAADTSGRPVRIAVVGGGAGGVELTLALRGGLVARAAKAAQPAAHPAFLLVSDGEILKTHHPRVRRAFRRILAEKGITLYENRRVASISERSLALSDGTRLESDLTLVATHAAPPAWFAETGLALDKGGFIAISPTLQSLNDENVFAAGDCAGLVESPCEKAGVYAVRAGPPLAVNLRRRARNQPLVRWQPQRRHLALISTGERYAVASRGWLKAEGRWVWTLKDWVDRRWLRPYQEPERGGLQS